MDNPVVMQSVDDLGFNAMGFEEPNAVNKWTDGSNFFVWLTNYPIEDNWDYLPEYVEEVEEQSMWHAYMPLVWDDYDLDSSGRLDKDEAIALLKHINDASATPAQWEQDDHMENEWDWYYEEDP